MILVSFVMLYRFCKVMICLLELQKHVVIGTSQAQIISLNLNCNSLNFLVAIKRKLPKIAFSSLLISRKRNI